ncbi:MAG: hypothetical protein AABX29_07530 [Nanoarchaeota archaeon]
MADAWKTFGLTISVLIILSLISYAFIYISRECNTNLDCPSDNYCAYNHKCYPFPQTKTETYSMTFIFMISIAAILILSYFYYKTLNKNRNKNGI